jgi:hypothetical protein
VALQTLSPVLGRGSSPFGEFEVQRRLITDVSLDRARLSRLNSSGARSANKSWLAMEILSVIFAYFSPEVTFPLAPALAASVGFIILVGRAPIRLASKALRVCAISLGR